MLHHVHPNQDGQDDHVDAKTDEHRESHKPVFVCFKGVSDVGHQRLYDRVEKSVDDENHHSCH